MKPGKQGWSRRQFIASTSSMGALLIAGPGQGTPWLTRAVGETSTGQIDPRVAAIVAKTIGVDTHNHIDVPLNASELPGPQIDLTGEMRQSGLSAICMTFAVDYQRLVNPGDAYERFSRGLDAVDNVLKNNNIARSMNLTDLQTAHAQHRPTVIQSVEGAHFLEGQLDRLGVAYQRGVRHLGLLHDNDASVPLGDVYTNPAQWGGLTKLGADAIRECNRLGMLIDLAHASNDTLNAALNITTQPVLISHTGLDSQLGQNAGMARMMRPRLISKEQAKRVADKGGIIGVWTHLADTPLEYAQNIRALVDVVGVDHVCIGTDTKLTPAYRSPGAGSGPKPNGSGNRPDGLPPAQNGPDGAKRERVGERTNAAWQDQTVGFYHAVVEAMLTTGFTEDEIGKIGGGNFCRVFDSATKGRS